MKFYVVEISTTAEGTAKAIAEKEDFNEARMLYHQILASMMANTNVTEGICTIIDSNARQLIDFTEKFVREAEENL